MCLVVFTILGILFWQVDGNILQLVKYLFIGISIAGGMILYAAFPKRKIGPTLSLFLVGGLLLGGLGLGELENIQIEGFFFYLLGGFSAGTVSHYFIAKIIGPIIFNLGWYNGPINSDSRKSKFKIQLEHEKKLYREF